MAIERLDAACRQEAARRQWPAHRVVSRCIHVLLSPSLGAVEEQVRSRFRLADPAFDPFYPWVDLSESDDVDERLTAALAGAFDADLGARLLYGGCTLLGSASQVVMLWDASDPKAAPKIARVHAALDAWLQGTGAAQPLYRVGVVRLAGAAAGAVPEAGRPGDPWGRFDRLFAADQRNRRTEVVALEQTVPLMAQMVLFLASYPLLLHSEGKASEFVHWMRTDEAGRGKITGFSCAAALFPVERMARWALLRRTGEILDHAVGLEADEDRARELLVSFLNRLHLHSAQSLVERLLAATERLADPLGAEDGALGSVTWTPDTGEEYARFLLQLDGRLPGLAKGREEILRQLFQEFGEDFRLELSDFLDWIMAREPAGVSLAARFLELLTDHMEELIPEVVPGPPAGPDVAAVASRLADETRRGPRLLSVLGRTAVLVLGMLAAWLGLGERLFEAPQAWFGVLVPLSAFAGWFYWHSWRTRMQRLVVTAQTMLEERWRELLAWHTDVVLQEHLPPAVGEVETKAVEVDKAARRLRQLADFFLRQYCPEPEVRPFQADLCADVRDPVRFVRQVLVDPAAFVREYFAANRPLALWKRLADPGGGESGVPPNAWEWHLAEELALALLPKASAIFEHSAGEQLRRHAPDGTPLSGEDGSTALDEDKVERTVKFLSSASCPFILWDPNRGGAGESCLLSLPHRASEVVRPRLEERLRTDFGRVDVFAFGSLYELLQVSVTSGLERDHVVPAGAGRRGDLGGA